ncbi:malonyl-CoA decarboxylase domain-containing protein [Ramlibacter sp. MAHUQ-53]|uniref:malonyl-CoA decarboxylase domain-containing protein n=1 Tax=unclassified Ramlibacter TaxID=2617605 RepID=UPI00363A7D7E
MFERFTRDRLLDATRQTAKRLISALGEANAQSIAARLIDHYERLDAAQRLAFFEFLASEFNPDPAQVKAVAEAYHADPSAKNLIALCTVAEPRRQELLRRINRAPRGTAALIGMRRALLGHLKERPAFAAIDADMHHLLSSWFNPGFLELHQITWNSPAQLLEKIIQHESVHAIDGWDDLRRRLQPDRRCFAFFHPQLPGEPLIFVEVALVPALATGVGVLIDKKTPVGERKTFKAAIFYSISNCQPGLKGVSLGNFLIKRVAQKLLEEIPSLKLYSTLSPIPGFTAWLDAGAPLPEEAAAGGRRRKLDEALQSLGLRERKWAERLKAGWHPHEAGEGEQRALMHLCAAYLALHTPTRGGDAVAKFHLANGATLHQINWAADLSRKGLQQSAGIMVNYLYELDKVEEQHEAFTRGVITRSKAMQRLT